MSRAVSGSQGPPEGRPPPAAAHPGGAGRGEVPAPGRRPPGARTEGRLLDPPGPEDQHRLLHLLPHRCVTLSDFPVYRMELLESMPCGGPFGVLLSM